MLRYTALYTYLKVQYICITYTLVNVTYLSKYILSYNEMTHSVEQKYYKVMNNVIIMLCEICNDSHHKIYTMKTL